jgi:hypothetical protein
VPTDTFSSQQASGQNFIKNGTRHPKKWLCNHLSRTSVAAWFAPVLVARRPLIPKQHSTAFLLHSDRCSTNASSASPSVPTAAPACLPASPLLHMRTRVVLLRYLTAIAVPTSLARGPELNLLLPVPKAARWRRFSSSQWWEAQRGAGGTHRRSVGSTTYACSGARRATFAVDAIIDPTGMLAMQPPHCSAIRVRLRAHYCLVPRPHANAARTTRREVRTKRTGRGDMARRCGRRCVRSPIRERNGRPEELRWWYILHDARL